MRDKTFIQLIVGALMVTSLWAMRLPASAETTPLPGQAESFAQRAQLLAPDGDAYEQFGAAVAIDGDTLVVGTTYFSNLGTASEPDAAYVFVRDGGAWRFQAKLTASDGTAGDRFGQAVAIDGDTILVGAHLADIDGNDDQGAAYVFTRSGETWTEQARLTAGDGAPGDEFGWSVSLSGDTALVGVNFRPVGGQPRQGAAYVFARSGSAWTQQQRLSAGDGAAADQFGYAVALYGATAAVGARGAAINGNIVQGAVYIFTRDGNDWSERAKLTAADGAIGDSLGGAVDFDGKTLIAGSRYSTIGGSFGRGAAYIFTGSGASWSEQAKLTASDYENNHEFGWSVAVDGGVALVGTPLGDPHGNVNQGAVYLYTLEDTVWTEETRLTAGDGAAGDYFGNSVALDAGAALVGAPRVDVDGNDQQGAAYLFQEWQGSYMLFLPAISSD